MVLGSEELSAAADTLIYSADQTRTIEQVIICNRGAATVAVRLWVVPRNTAKANKHAWAYDTPIPANASYPLPGTSFTMQAQERILGYTDIATVSINVVGT